MLDYVLCAEVMADFKGAVYLSPRQLKKLSPKASVTPRTNKPGMIYGIDFGNGLVRIHFDKESEFLQACEELELNIFAVLESIESARYRLQEVA